jgi:hypothetical protein
MNGQLRAPGRFTRRDIAHCTHWIEGWTGPKFGLNTGEEKKSCRAGNRIQEVQPVVRRYTDLISGR